MNPAVCIETVIPSYLATRPGNDIRNMASVNATAVWWERQRGKFDVYVSEFVIAEASQGDQEAAGR